MDNRRKIVDAKQNLDASCQTQNWIDAKQGDAKFTKPILILHYQKLVILPALVKVPRLFTWSFTWPNVISPCRCPKTRPNIISPCDVQTSFLHVDAQKHVQKSFSFRREPPCFRPYPEKPLAILLYMSSLISLKACVSLTFFSGNIQRIKPLLETLLRKLFEKPKRFRIQSRITEGYVDMTSTTEGIQDEQDLYYKKLNAKHKRPSVPL